MPNWRKRLVTEEWQQQVRQHFADSGRGAQANLCREVNERFDTDVKEGTLSLLLKPGRQSSSKWIEPISIVLGINLPPVDSDDGMLGRLMSAGAQLDEDELRHLVGIAESLSSK